MHSWKILEMEKETREKMILRITPAIGNLEVVENPTSRDS